MEAVHGETYINLVQDLSDAGHRVVGPTEKIFDYGFPHVCQWAEVKDRIDHVSKADLEKAGIDIIWCSSSEQCRSAVALGQKLRKPVILSPAVNDSPYKDSDSPYMISYDVSTFMKAPIRHKLLYAPAPDSIYHPPVPLDASRENVALSLIVKHRELWPVQYDIWTKISSRYGCQMRFDHHETLGRNEVAEKLRKASILLHLKGSEGWGWSLAEAAVSGCPVIVNGDLPVGRTCGLFLKHGVNAWFLDMRDPVTDFGKALGSLKTLLMDQGRYGASILNRQRYLTEFSKFITWVAADVGRITPPTIRSLVPQ